MLGLDHPLVAGGLTALNLGLQGWEKDRHDRAQFRRRLLEMAIQRRFNARDAEIDAQRKFDIWQKQQEWKNANPDPVSMLNAQTANTRAGTAADQAAGDRAYNELRARTFEEKQKELERERKKADKIMRLVEAWEKLRLQYDERTPRGLDAVRQHAVDLGITGTEHFIDWQYKIYAPTIQKHLSGSEMVKDFLDERMGTGNQNEALGDPNFVGPPYPEGAGATQPAGPAAPPAPGQFLGEGVGLHTPGGGYSPGSVPGTVPSAVSPADMVRPGQMQGPDQSITQPAADTLDVRTMDDPEPLIADLIQKGIAANRTQAEAIVRRLQQRLARQQQPRMLNAYGPQP